MNLFQTGVKLIPKNSTVKIYINNNLRISSIQNRDNQSSSIVHFDENLNISLNQNNDTTSTPIIKNPIRLAVIDELTSKNSESSKPLDLSSRFINNCINILKNSD